MILAMAKLQHTLCRYTRLRTDAGAIDMHLVSRQRIDTHCLLIQSACELRPSCVVTQASQDNFQPIVREIEALDSLSCRCPERPRAMGHPRFDMHEAVIAPRQNGTAPEGTDPAQTETLPVTVRGKVAIHQRRETHPLHLLEQERNVIDALRDNTLDCIHTQSLAQSPIYLQIWANRKFQCGTMAHMLKERQQRLQRNKLAHFYHHKHHNLLAPLNLYKRQF